VQFIFGLFTLRSKWGNDALRWLANITSTMIKFVDVGTNFLFSKDASEHAFVFRVSYFSIV